MTGRPAAATRVLVCEDSRTYAAALVRVLEFDGEIEVVGVAPTAEEALAALSRLEPNLVTMDVELPGMSGLEAVEQIMASQPRPILVLSSHVRNGSELAAAALAAGALDALPKDELDLRDPSGAAAAALRERAKVLGRARVIRHPRARLTPKRPSGGTGPAPQRPERRASAIGICASTGGPQALFEVLSALPASFPVPVLVVQHMAAGFIEGLARWLDASVPLPVRIAEQDAKPAPGVWMAPEGAHLVLQPSGRLGLDRTTVSGYHRPSADVLLRSLAETAGPAAVGVVLTGMGRDGAEGVEALRGVGALTVTQDEKTSAIFGMPKAAAERGAELILPLAQIAPLLAALRLERRRRPR